MPCDKLHSPHPHEVIIREVREIKNPQDEGQVRDRVICLLYTNLGTPLTLFSRSDTSKNLHHKRTCMWCIKEGLEEAQRDKQYRHIKQSMIRWAQLHKNGIRNIYPYICSFLSFAYFVVQFWYKVRCQYQPQITYIMYMGALRERFDCKRHYRWCNESYNSITFLVVIRITCSCDRVNLQAREDAFDSFCVAKNIKD